MIHTAPLPAAAPAAGRSAAAAAPYARIKQHLKNELARGRWPAGAAMPSDAELVAQFGVSRMTVTRALNELRAEGLIERIQGVGTFAAHLARVSSTLQIRDLHEEIESGSGTLMAGAIAGAIEDAQDFAGVGQTDEQRMITPDAVVGDVHAFFALGIGAHQRAVHIDAGKVKEIDRLLFP
jgi:DNA-binding transcriptional regulator YhcF (GntR family)